MICQWISKSAIGLYMLSPELNYIQVKFGVNPSISFKVTGQNVILYRWSILNGNGSSWLVLHFQVLLDSIDLTWRHVAKSSHLAVNVMTDTHTHRHTHRQILGEKHNAFRHNYDLVFTVNYFSISMTINVKQLRHNRRTF